MSLEIALHQGCRLSETSQPLDRVDLKRGTITFSAKGRNGKLHVFTTALHPGLRPLVERLKAAGVQKTSGLGCRPIFAECRDEENRIGHPEAGQRSAILYSLIISCQRYGKDPLTY